MHEKRAFFVCDDYGMGGIWLVIDARSAREIEKAYPELTVFEEPPAFLAPETRDRIATKERFDIDAPPRGYLAEIVAGR